MRVRSAIDRNARMKRTNEDGYTNYRRMRDFSRSRRYVRIDHETDLVAAVIYIDPFELIFGRKFRVRAVWRALRAANLRRNGTCYDS